MKSKLLSILLICVLILGVAGCSKKEKTKKVEVTGPRVVCKNKDDLDDIKMASTIILKFNSDKYVNYQLLESVLTFKTKDTFNYYSKSTKEGAETMELAEGVDYNYSIDKKHKKIITTMIYNESIFDYSKATDEEKNYYLASSIVKAYEDSGATCEFIEMTREDLGL